MRDDRVGVWKWLVRDGLFRQKERGLYLGGIEATLGVSDSHLETWCRGARLPTVLDMTVDREAMFESARYLMVSGSGVAVNLGAFGVLHAFGFPAIVCGATAFVAAFQHNLLWHGRFTFGGRSRPDSSRPARFFLVSLATLAVDLAVLSALESGGAPPLFAQAVGIAAACPLNFLGSRLWVFVEPSPMLREARVPERRAGERYP